MGIDFGTLSGIGNGTLWDGALGGSVATGAGTESIAHGRRCDSYSRAPAWGCRTGCPGGAGSSPRHKGLVLGGLSRPTPPPPHGVALNHRSFQEGSPANEVRSLAIIGPRTGRPSPPSHNLLDSLGGSRSRYSALRGRAAGRRAQDAGRSNSRPRSSRRTRPRSSRSKSKGARESGYTDHLGWQDPEHRTVRSAWNRPKPPPTEGSGANRARTRGRTRSAVLNCAAQKRDEWGSLPLGSNPVKGLNVSQAVRQSSPRVRVPPPDASTATGGKLRRVGVAGRGVSDHADE